jgi:hypothetical protein
LPACKAEEPWHLRIYDVGKQGKTPYRAKRERGAQRADEPALLRVGQEGHGAWNGGAFMGCLRLQLLARKLFVAHPPQYNGWRFGPLFGSRGGNVVRRRNFMLGTALAYLRGSLGRLLAVIETSLVTP